MSGAAEKIPFSVKAESIEACNCRHGCNCQFEGIPNEGKSELIIGYNVKDGRLGNVSLNGVKAVIAAKYPKATHEGNGHVVLFVDDKASQDQADAIVAIFSGQMDNRPD